MVDVESQMEATGEAAESDPKSKFISYIIKWYRSVCLSSLFIKIDILRKKSYEIES